VSEDRRVVTTAENEAEAELICGRLAEAGIHAVAQRAIGGPEWGASGSRYIYVAAGDLERAKTLLDVS
jgi:putative signal transducing protein